MIGFLLCQKMPPPISIGSAAKVRQIKRNKKLLAAFLPFRPVFVDVRHCPHPHDNMLSASPNGATYYSTGCEPCETVQLHNSCESCKDDIKRRQEFMSSLQDSWIFYHSFSQGSHPVLCYVAPLGLSDPPRAHNALTPSLSRWAREHTAPLFANLLIARECDRISLAPWERDRVRAP